MLTQEAKPQTAHAPTAKMARPIVFSAKAVPPLVWVLILGAIVRLLLWLPFYDRGLAIWDENDYNTLAVSLAQRGEYAFKPGELTSLRPPLLPFVLAGVYEVVGTDRPLVVFQVVRFGQLLISLATVIVVYFLGKEVYSPRAGFWAATLFCFYPSMLGFNNLILTETLFTFFLTTSIYLLILFLRREGAWAWTALALAGVCLGLAALTRSVVWMYPPVLAVWLLIGFRKTLWTRLLAPLTFVLAFAATIGPWSYRCTQLEKTFIAIDCMGGRNFMMGNYEHTLWERTWDTIRLQDEQSWNHVLIQRYPEAATVTQGQKDKLAFKCGLDYIVQNPGLSAQRAVRKFFDFWGLERELVAGMRDGNFGRCPPGAIVLAAAVVFSAYVAAMLLGVFGAIVSPPKDRRGHLLLVLTVLFVCGMHTIVFGHSRYHLPLMPLVLVFAGSALVNVSYIWKSRRHWTFWSACALAGLFVVGWALEIFVFDTHRYLEVLQKVF